MSKWRKTHRPTYVWSLRNQLARFLHYLHEIGGPDLTRELDRIRQPRPRQTTATQDELAALLAHAAPWMRCFLLLTGQLGLRFTEAALLCPANYDPDRHTITYVHKGGDQNTLPTSPDVDTLFAAAPLTDDPHTPYIQLLRGSQQLRRPHISHFAVRHEFARLKRKAGVRDELRPHDLRRTAAVSMYEHTHDLRIAQQLLGHSHLSSTARYLTHVDAAKMRTLFDQLHFPTKRTQ